MPELDETIAFLAVEEKPNSFYPIEIKDLNTAYKSCHSLRGIDGFTSSMEESAIRGLIKEANVIPDNAIDAPLVVVYTNYGVKRKAPIITKDFLEKYNTYNMIFEIFGNKEFANYALNKVRRLNIEDGVKSDLELAIKNNDASNFFDIFDDLPYVVQRYFYLYLAKGIKNRDNKSRVLEKPNKEVD